MKHDFISNFSRTPLETAFAQYCFAEMKVFSTGIRIPYTFYRIEHDRTSSLLFQSQPESSWKGKKMEKLQRNYRLGQNGNFEIKSPNNDVLQLEVENGNITVNPNTDGWQIEKHERSTSTHGGSR